MDDPVVVTDLTKIYKVPVREAGLKESIKSLFKREHRLVRAVDEISFTVGEGEIVGFLGPNGAGKTTTLKMLSGLLHADGGDARVLGYQPWMRAKELLSQITLVLGQRQNLAWDLPALDSFELNKAIYQIPQADNGNESKRTRRAGFLCDDLARRGDRLLHLADDHNLRLQTDPRPEHGPDVAGHLSGRALAGVYLPHVAQRRPDLHRAIGIRDHSAGRSASPAPQHRDTCGLNRHNHRCGRHHQSSVALGFVAVLGGFSLRPAAPPACTTPRWPPNGSAEAR